MYSGSAERNSPPSAAAAARTSQAFTDIPSARAAASTPARRFSGSRSVTRHVPPSSSDSGATYGGVVRQFLNAGDRELGVAPSQPHLDRTGREIAGDLLGRLGQRLEQRQPDRRLQRGGQTVGKRLGIRSPRGGCYGQFVAHPVHIRL